MKRGLLLWLPLVVFAALVALVGWQLIKPADREVHSAMVGKPLPAFALPAIVAAKPGLASTDFHDGKPRLLNVFASWCVPCIAEAPQLMALKQAGVEIDAIAVRDKREDVFAFLARNGDPYARIGDDEISRTQLSLGSSGVPESFVIDGQGKIVLQHIGDIRPEHMAEILAAVQGAK